MRYDGARWEFLSGAIDDHARIGFTQMKLDERQDSAIAFLRASVAYFAGLASRFGVEEPQSAGKKNFGRGRVR